jgi:hypothetical protein
MVGKRQHPYSAQAATLGGQLVFRCAVPIACNESAEGGDENTGWLHIASEGTWQGHKNGDFSLDADVFAAFIERFEETENDMLVDYDHRSLSLQGSSDDSKAAGWITQLEVRQGEGGAELWGLVSWTDDAAEMIRADELRYCSPVINFDATDRQSGEEVGPMLINVGATNNPFLDGNTAIQLTRTRSMPMEANVIETARERAQLQLNALDALERVKAETNPDDSDYDVVDKVWDELGKEHEREVIQEVLEGAGGIPKADAGGEEGDDPTATTAGEGDEGEGDPAEMNAPGDGAADAAVSKLAEALEMDSAAVAAALDENAAEVADLLRSKLDEDGSDADAAATTQKVPDEEVAEMKIEAQEAKIVKLTAEVETLKKDKGDRDKAHAMSVVDGLIESKRMHAKRRDTAIKLYLTDRKTFDELWGADAPGDETPLGEQGGKRPTAAIDAETVKLTALPEGTRELALSLKAAGFKGGNERECIKYALEKQEMN